MGTVVPVTTIEVAGLRPSDTSQGLFYSLGGAGEPAPPMVDFLSRVRYDDYWLRSSSNAAASSSMAAWAVFSPLTTAVMAMVSALSISLQAATVGRAFAV